MTGLRLALAGYLDLRRGLGFKLDRDAKLLEQFITYLEQRGTGTVTVTGALAWATLPANASPGWLRMRMTVVRGFAAYLATLDPSAEVPPASLLPGGTRRAVPCLYSAAGIAALLTQAGRLKTPLRQETIKTLIGLMAVTGMLAQSAGLLSSLWLIAALFLAAFAAAGSLRSRPAARSHGVGPVAPGAARPRWQG